MPPDGAPAIELAELAARAAAEVPGVTGLDGGPFGGSSTYGRGRRCRGVVVTREAGRTRLVVRVTASFGTRLPELGESVRDAAERAVHDAYPSEAPSVDVEITDLVDQTEADGPL